MGELLDRVIATQRANDLLSGDDLIWCAEQAATIVAGRGYPPVIGTDATGERVIGAMLAHGHPVTMVDSTTTLPAECVAVFGAMAGRAQAIAELRSMLARGAWQVHVITIGGVGEIEGAHSQQCIEPVVSDVRHSA